MFHVEPWGIRERQRAVCRSNFMISQAKWDELVDSVNFKQTLIDENYRIVTQLRSILSHIDVLRSPAGSGNSVTIFCENDDPPPNQAIECKGDWTEWQDRRFEGDTLLDCLKAAVAAKTKT